MLFWPVVSDVFLGSSRDTGRKFGKNDHPRRVPFDMRHTFSKFGSRSFDTLREIVRTLDINVPFASTCLAENHIIRCFRGGSTAQSRALNMKDPFDEDRWLGGLHSFPTILHARASLSFDMNPASVQKALVSALSSFRKNPVSRMITVADQEGYSNGSAHFKVGVGNGEGFDILDVKEKERLLDRIENRGAFESLDLAVHISYTVADGRRHKIHQDHYVIRLVFEPGRFEALIHHMRGIRRVDPAELIDLITTQLNSELTREKFPAISVDRITST